MMSFVRRSPVLVWSPHYHLPFGGNHVFPVEKYQLLHEALVEEGLLGRFDVVPPVPLTRGQLMTVHTERYIDELLACVPTPRTMRAEVPLTSEVVSAELLASGGTLVACRAALETGAAVNLGGGFHHAFPDHGEGFCYVNDMAVAVRTLKAEGLVKRVLIVDLDLHQGNGTAFAFRDDPDVFTFSMHQESLYPPKQRSDLDVGLDNGTGDRAYLRLLGRSLRPLLVRQKPDLVLYQAGADPYRDDLLGSLLLTKRGLEARDRMVIRLCRSRRVPVAVVLGGGYAADVRDTVAIHLATCRAVAERRR
jgi:acetoin utilization deacetylase AcuC-like enzyme